MLNAHGLTSLLHWQSRGFFIAGEASASVERFPKFLPTSEGARPHLGSFLYSFSLVSKCLVSLVCGHVRPAAPPILCSRSLSLFPWNKVASVVMYIKCYTLLSLLFFSELLRGLRVPQKSANTIEYTAITQVVARSKNWRVAAETVNIMTILDPPRVI